MQKLESDGHERGCFPTIFPGYIPGTFQREGHGLALVKIPQGVLDKSSFSAFCAEPDLSRVPSGGSVDAVWDCAIDSC